MHITDYPKPSNEVEKEEKSPSGGETQASEPVRDEKATQSSAAPPEMKQPKQVESKPSPTVAQPSIGAQLKKPMEPAQQMPAQQTGKLVVPPAGTGNAFQPISVTPAPAGQAVPRSGTPSFPAFANGPPPGMFLALLAGFMTVILIVSAVLYFYSSLCLFLIAKKLDVPAAWLAWIPILQVWAFFRSAGKSLWWILLLFIPLVNLIVLVYLWMCIAENLGKNKWLGLLTLVPVANLILPAILAFSKKEGAVTPTPAVA
jgi:hypothetical protein